MKTNQQFLLLFWGAPAAGKSSLAERLCQRWRIAGEPLTYLSSDAVNQTILGGEFVSQLRPAIYDTLALLANRSLQSGLPVVVDGTYLKREARQELLTEGDRRAALSLSVLVHCSLEERLQRNASRPDHTRVPDQWIARAHWSAEYQKREASLVVETDQLDLDGCLDKILDLVQRRMRRLGGIHPRIQSAK
jgi:predicted kinase